MLSESVYWGFLLAVAVLTVSLMGQAAFLRSRLDRLAPAAMQLSSDDPAAAQIETNRVDLLSSATTVRAYALKIDAEATRTLRKADPFVRLTASDLGIQACSCPHTKYDAQWLVVRGPVGSPGASRLAADLRDGTTRYLQHRQAYAVISSGVGSDLDTRARALLQAPEGDDLLLLLLCPVSKITCLLPPFRPEPGASPSGDDIFNAQTATSDQSFAHVWGYGYRTGSQLGVQQGRNT